MRCLGDIVPKSEVSLIIRLLLFAEIAFEQPSETSTVACLIFCHFMDSVVNSVEASFLSIYSDAEFVLACSSLSSGTFLKIGLGIPDTLTEQFCKLSSMLSLFESITLESLGNLGISLAVSLARHGQIHTYLTALTIEVIAKVLNHLLAYALRLAITNFMLSGICCLFYQFFEL